jgi:hypothetical protein
VRCRISIFGGWAGRWHKPLRVFGPSGRTPEFGSAHMIEGMKEMLHWHRDAFAVFPVGKGHDIEVNEFDFRDNGGVVYEQNGVRVIHWQRSHAKDGASAYRLDWNGLSMVWTGDGRPSLLDAEFASGADVYITETQAELCAISSGVQGVPPFLGRYRLDTHDTPAYAAIQRVQYVQRVHEPARFGRSGRPRKHRHEPFKVEGRVDCMVRGGSSPLGRTGKAPQSRAFLRPGTVADAVRRSTCCCHVASTSIRSARTRSHTDGQQTTSLPLGGAFDQIPDRTNGQRSGEFSRRRAGCRIVGVRTAAADVCATCAMQYELSVSAQQGLTCERTQPPAFRGDHDHGFMSADCVSADQASQAGHALEISPQAITRSSVILRCRIGI